MKRYMLFAYAGYYPSGGWNDFRGSFDSVDEALVALKSLDREEYSRAEFWHIIDSETLEYVEHKGYLQG